MATFLGWLSYDLKAFCDICGEYDPDDAHEHEDCLEESDGKEKEEE